MKQIFLSAATLLLFVNSFCQSLPEFAPVGAIWHFTQPTMYGDIHYFSIQSVSADTLAGKPCKLLSSYGAFAADSEHLFVFDSYLNRWNVIADFSTAVGDSFSILSYGLSDSFFVKVLAKDDTLINGYSLQFLVTDLYHNTVVGHQPILYGGRIVQNIGAESLIVPQISWADPTSGPFRCYEDVNLGLYRNPGYDLACNYTYTYVGIDDALLFEGTKIFPSSTHDIIHAEILPQLWNTAMLCSVDGIKLIEKKIDPSASSLDFDLSSLAQGMYFLTFRSKENQLVNKVIRY